MTTRKVLIQSPWVGIILLILFFISILSPFWFVFVRGMLTKDQEEQTKSMEREISQAQWRNWDLNKKSENFVLLSAKYGIPQEKLSKILYDYYVLTGLGSVALQLNFRSDLLDNMDNVINKAIPVDKALSILSDRYSIKIELLAELFLEEKKVREIDEIYKNAD